MGKSSRKQRCQSVSEGKERNLCRNMTDEQGEKVGKREKGRKKREPQVCKGF